jgi:hypothetical protein
MREIVEISLLFLAKVLLATGLEKNVKLVRVSETCKQGLT